MPIEFAVLGLLTESLDKIVKVVVGGGQLADFKHIPHLLCFLVVHGLISPKSGYSEYPECCAEHGDIPILRTALVASVVQAKTEFSIRFFCLEPFNSLIQKEFRSCRIDLHLKFKVLLPILCAVIDIDHGQTDALYPGVVNAVEVDVVIILIRFHMDACKNGIHMEPTGDIEGNGVIIHPLRILQP